MKLWKTTVTYDVEVVIAAEERPGSLECCDAAWDEMIEYLNADNGISSPPIQIVELDQLPKNWRNTRPRGDSLTSRNCLQILDDYKPDVEPFGEQDTLPEMGDA